MESDPTDLVRAAQKGSREAFTDIVRRYERAAGAIAYARTGDPEVSAEVVQEACLRAFLRIRSLKDPGRFGPWFATMVANLARDRVRRSKIERAALSKLPPRGETTAQPSAVREQILRALNELEEEPRTMIVLRFMEGLPYREIAKLMDLPVNRVKWGLHLAFKTLKTKLRNRV